MNARTDQAIGSHASVMLAIAIVLLSLVNPPASCAATLQEVPNLVAGGEFDYVVERGDDLVSLSARYGISEALLASGNSRKRDVRLRRGEVLRIDNRHLVPKNPGDGIIINIPQRMLFYFERGALVSYYPVSLGRRDWRTPTGSFIVDGKRVHPTWIVPPSIQNEMEENGKEVETEVPPGPDNPLGDYALDLTLPGYRIHGTIAPLSIYAFRTHGCIRLHPADIEDLFGRVAIGATGEIIYQPVMLAATPDGRVFLEANRDIYRRAPESLAALRAAAEIQNVSERIDWQLAEKVLSRAEGIAREVGRSNH